MDALIPIYRDYLSVKYSNIVRNKWFWLVFALLVLIGVFAYAFYCTSRGYSFSGNVKLNWPKIWQMGIGCKAN